MFKYFPKLALAFFVCLITGATAHAECVPKSYEELVSCAVGQSMEIKVIESQHSANQELEGVARQWANPEVEVESVQKDSQKSETSAALLFPIRLGGKRGAEIAEAEAEVERSKASRDFSTAESRLQLMLKFYRLSHLRREIHVEQESVDAFQKIIRQYQKKPALSPEHEVSLSVFRMAATDHSLKLADLRSEEESLYQSIRASTGLSREVVSKNLPDRKQNWPVLRMPNAEQISPQLRIAKSELMLAESRYDRAKADSWPDIKIGPSVKIVKQPEATEQFVGVALSMPLPIFTLNGSGRSYGAKKLAEAEVSHELAKRQEAGLRRQLIEKYQSKVTTFKSMITTKVVEEKHDRLEKLVLRGLVPSSLVIEAHRQLSDLEEKKNECEREAIEALGLIYITDNMFEGIIL